MESHSDMDQRARAKAKAEAEAVTIREMTEAQVEGLALSLLRDGAFDASIFCIEELKRRASD